MAELILTGASRGIGHALALALAGQQHADRLVLVARDRARLEALAAAVEQKGGRAIAVPGNLSSLAEARALGQRLADTVTPGATLVHNAGLWPSQRVHTPEGLEAAFVVNHLAPLVMQQALLEAGRLRRIIRTYCNTKLCFALAMRDVAAAHPELDVVVLHPGVVRTDLGARRGPAGWLLSLVKRGWEAPEVCAARLARILARERWSPAGEARWLVEEQEQPWPAVAQDEATRRAVRDTTARLLTAA